MKVYICYPLLCQTLLIYQLTNSDIDCMSHRTIQRAKSNMTFSKKKKLVPEMFYILAFKKILHL